MTTRGDETRDARQNADSATVTVEAVSWMTRFVGGSGTGRVLLPESLHPGDTPCAVLHRTCHRYPQLDDVLWDRSTGEPGEHVQIMINNVLIGPAEVANQPLQPGDTITLLSPYMGG